MFTFNVNYDLHIVRYAISDFVVSSDDMKFMTFLSEMAGGAISWKSAK